MRDPEFCLVCASNDETTLRANLFASDLAQQVGETVVIRDARSASAAYNQGLAETSAPFAIFAHQDVYFPPGWLAELRRAIADLTSQDPDWAVLAPFGISNMQHRGTVYSTSLSAVVGQPVAFPVAAESVDELVIVLRRSSNVRFDDQLPDWHLYGTDIVQTALSEGKGAWIADLPLVHNDKFHPNLNHGFRKAYRAILRKWRSTLPIRTPVLWLRPSGLDLVLFQIKAWRSRSKRKKRAGDTATDPRNLSRQCGWETA